MNTMRDFSGMRTWALCLGAMLISGVCFGAAQADPAALIEVATGKGATGTQVTIPVTLYPEGTQPASLSFSLLFDAAAFEFVNVTTGAAAAAAGKTAESNVPEAGVVKILVWGLNAGVMGEGEILEAKFTVLAPGNQRDLSLSVADPAASDPNGNAIDLFVGANCGDLTAPPDVAASQDRSDGVEVTWGAVTGAAAYQVYRNDTEDPAASQPVSDWLPADSVSFLDTTAESPPTNVFGCAQGPGPVYYYWVRAANDSHCAGDFSASATGSRGAAKRLDAGAGVFSGDMFLAALAGVAAWALSRRRLPRPAGRLER